MSLLQVTLHLTLLRAWKIIWIKLFTYFFGQYSASEDDRAFRAFCGVHPAVAETIWRRYQTQLLQNVFDLDRTWILMTLHFLKNYPTEDCGSRIFKMTRKTYRKRLSITLKELERSMDEVHFGKICFTISHYFRSH